ncbi:hypothetical protein JQ615_19810 [Bradyrhizobium jicamae]|uniref:Uncharacterized protein n=1 Tax=Bradyrhizobium jicamae TaxID=280332 RepID=A0ABS5FLH3_9BRAD|nr:hypothetical protein [Bradyrhizobium jicamae]MBR0797635.1 hypothetical protein [Bradyrhizobium jicamae]MBR0939412.1 hypothetical protein [Bradyrhizobium jicamae]
MSPTIPPEELRSRLAALISSTPSPPANGQLPPDTEQWVADACALIGATADLTLQSEAQNASNGLHYEQHRLVNFQKLRLILRKALSQTELDIAVHGVAAKSAAGPVHGALEISPALHAKAEAQAEEIIAAMARANLRPPPNLSDEPYQAEAVEFASGSETHRGRAQGVGAKGMAAGEGSATAEPFGPTRYGEQPPMAAGGPNGTTGPSAILHQNGSPLLTEHGSPLLYETADTVRVNPRAVIVRAVLDNQIQAHITAVSLLSAIELKIEALRVNGSNSEIDNFYDLKRQVEEFLAANARRDETPIANATLSIADGLRRFWTEKHVSICDRTLDMTLFGAGLAFCGVAGVLVVPTALTVGAIVGGKNVVETLKAAANLLPGKKKE